MQTFNITVTVSNIAEESFPELALACLQKRWVLQRGVAEDSNSLYLKDNFGWRVPRIPDGESPSDKVQQAAMLEVQALVESLNLRALDSNGICISSRLHRV